MTPQPTRTMHKAVLIAAVALGPLSSARQPPHFYRSNDGQLVIRYGSFVLDRLSDSVSRMVIHGGIDGTSKSQGLRVRGQLATAVLTTIAKKTAFKAIHLERSVELVKSVVGSGGNRSTDITCAKADYTAGTAESTVRGYGQVHIVDRDNSKHEVMSAVGSTCVATLLPGESSKSGSSPLKAATLNGPVTIHLDQAPKAAGKPPGTLVATSDNLSYKQVEDGSEVTLKGNVMLNGRNGTIDGKLGPNQVIVLQLDSLGRVKSASGGSSQ